MTQGNLPRSPRQSELRASKASVDDDVDRHRSAKLKNQSPMGQPFFYAKSHVHMLGQNEAYDTRKHPKKFQRNPTCTRPTLRWTTTWSPSVGDPKKSITHGRKPPKKFQGDQSRLPGGRPCGSLSIRNQ
ncbi:uncharacterized protein G2W53_027072 [Senna tora]|uniref:Uncharacterized protein n=1 Tax=Senna tora TaxID=362788 RepID=A0A834WG86_9FABA|nr:uncharacterized protein G2W53_027072 [Senna tora]